MSAVWRIENLSHTEKLVLLCLADNANDDGVCWPAIDNIRKRCSLNKSTVSEVIHRLEAAGYLSIKKRFSQSAIYTVSGLAVKRPVQKSANPSSSSRPARPPV